MLRSAIGLVTPEDVPADRHKEIHRACNRKLAGARVSGHCAVNRQHEVSSHNRYQLRSVEVTLKRWYQRNKHEAAGKHRCALLPQQ